jgi:hypothetical protein
VHIDGIARRIDQDDRFPVNIAEPAVPEGRVTYNKDKRLGR